MFSAKKKLYLLVLVACLIDFLFFYLVLFPLVKRIQINANNLDIQKNSLAIAEERNGKLEVLQKNIDNLKKNSQFVQNAFIDSSAPVQFMEFLEKQAQNHRLGLAASLFNLSDTKNDLWLAIGVRLEIEGQLADCLRFMETIENSHWVVAITRFDLQKIKQKETTGEFQENPGAEILLSLDIKAFSGKLPALKKSF
ncbi:hypothetical protein COT20_00675 [bacterium (Candidatus Gribaldobacteria) CG08_land_8_20_14_0_20_39_15]|uniref:Type 4a pilus biogenesis protein PilO n=1 Tax=bacterium (Candidatus Gribaldobacteria) CG08_land_8_20_14_0_20_39_15 TaxID=2014273 RepID=A0A2M6XV29_9BACT|nr:MAG: hypothetical protein COT20_00675 [bacterium (Candidatus Gribaldobacteria) CG08_land_8_20_14_0_20_39_15]